jgi:hypothetical protein
VRKWFHWICPDPKRQIANFCKDRSRQPEEQFLAACGLPSDDREAAQVALAVRRAVAKTGSIDPLFIRAEDVYPDQLSLLPLWDSMDWCFFTMALEEELGTRLSDQGEVLVAQRVSVKQMVADVQRILRGRNTA